MRLCDGSQHDFALGREWIPSTQMDLPLQIGRERLEIQLLGAFVRDPIVVQVEFSQCWIQLEAQCKASDAIVY